MHHQSYYMTLNQMKQEQSMAGTTCNSHFSQPSGKVSYIQLFENLLKTQVFVN